MTKMTTDQKIKALARERALLRKAILQEIILREREQAERQREAEVMERRRRAWDEIEKGGS